MKWIEDKTGYDHWEFGNNEIVPLEKRSSSDLKHKTKDIEEVIKNEEERLGRKFPDSLNYFLRGGELYTYKRTPGGQLTREEIKVDLKKLAHKRFPKQSRKTKKIIKPKLIPYTEEEIDEIKYGIRWLGHKRVRRHMLDIALLRSSFGKEYFKIDEKKKDILETEKDYNDVKTLQDKNAQMTDKEIFKLIALQKNKSWTTVKSNYNYYYLIAVRKAKGTKKL